MQRWVDIGVLVLVLVVAAVTALAAALLWRDGYMRGWRQARVGKPLCPRCRYDLSGAMACCCPECGMQYRLGELWRAVLLRAGAEGDQPVPGGGGGG